MTVATLIPEGPLCVPQSARKSLRLQPVNRLDRKAPNKRMIPNPDTAARRHLDDWLPALQIHRQIDLDALCAPVDAEMAAIRH